MTSALRTSWARHPLLRQALLWSIPALLFAAVLRLLLLSYSPYAYWGSDSRSYFDFTYKLYTEHYLSLVEKRRFLYPIFVAVVNALPGSPLRWLAWIQHGFGILAVLPVAYLIRKTCVAWRWWIVPITLLYAGMPVLLWYEHELLAETLVFSMVAWSFAGWTAWALEERKERAARLWWYFLVPFACLILLKASMRFYWPGIGLGILGLLAWMRVSRAGLIATLALMLLTLFVGSKKQGAWLMYTATFPLTQTQTPVYAEYKAEIADKVREYHDKVQYYFHEDDWAFSFLENPSKQTERKLWHDLESHPEIKSKLYTTLALEGIKAEPLNFLLMGRDRLLSSANVSTFKESRFGSSYMPERFADDYRHAEQTVANGRASYEAMALGLPPKGPLPPFTEIAQRLAPRHDSLAEQFITGYVDWFERHSDLVRWPEVRQRHLLGNTARPTLLGCYLLLAMVSAFLVPRFLKTHAVWVLAALSYLSGVFLLTQVNPRYFGATWPVLIPILALPLDLLVRVVAGLLRRRSRVAGEV